MGRFVDADKLNKKKKYLFKTESGAFPKSEWFIKADDLFSAPTVEAIPKEEVRQFIENIQKIKDNHNEYGEPINYGTICGILIEGYRLLDKYRKGKDGNDKTTVDE